MTVARGTIHRHLRTYSREGLERFTAGYNYQGSGFCMLTLILQFTRKLLMFDHHPRQICGVSSQDAKAGCRNVTGILNPKLAIAAAPIGTEPPSTLKVHSIPTSSILDLISSLSSSAKPVCRSTLYRHGRCTYMVTAADQLLID